MNRYLDIQRLKLRTIFSINREFGLTPVSRTVILNDLKEIMLTIIENWCNLKRNSQKRYQFPVSQFI